MCVACGAVYTTTRGARMGNCASEQGKEIKKESEKFCVYILLLVFFSPASRPAWPRRLRQRTTRRAHPVLPPEKDPFEVYNISSSNKRESTIFISFLSLYFAVSLVLSLVAHNND